MTPTLCPRCGGHADRCECAELRREGMINAAGWFALQYNDGKGRHYYEAMRDILALASKPEPL
jgi:hypothetical protein